MTAQSFRDLLHGFETFDDRHDPNMTLECALQEAASQDSNVLLLLNECSAWVQSTLGRHCTGPRLHGSPLTSTFCR